MPHTQQSASDNNGEAPRVLRDKINFETNKGEFMRLEFDPPSEPHPGRYGDSFVYFVEGGKIAFLDPPADAAVKACGAKAGDEIRLTKTEVRRNNRRAIEWIAERV